MAIDCYEAEPGQEEFEKNPWIIPPSLLKSSCDRDLMDWFCRSAPENARHVGYIITYDLDDPTVEVAVIPEIAKQTFNKLVSQWKEETWFISSIKKRIAHSAYLKIIGLGQGAVPWILEELKREPDYWYAALEAITRADPAPHAESMRELMEAWLAWGKVNGY